MMRATPGDDKKKSTDYTDYTDFFIFFIICANLCNLWTYFHSSILVETLNKVKLIYYCFHGIILYVEFNYLPGYQGSERIQVK